MGDSAHIAHHTDLGLAHVVIKNTRRNIFVTQKNLDVSRQVLFLHCIGLRRENRAEKFPSVRKFDENGSPK